MRAQNASAVAGSTGSAPLIAARSEERSSPCRSSSETLRAARPYAKFGATVRVARASETACIQLAGRSMNSSGDNSQQVAPWATGASSPPISPMSWYSGSQETTRSRAVRRSAVPIASTFAARFAAVITTPRGVRVLPDVYWISAVSSPVEGSAGGASAGASARGSITGSPESRSPESRRWAAVRRSANTADGAASRTTLLSRFAKAAGRANPSREGSGTGTAPIMEAPRKLSRKARPVGTQRSTRSPRRSPVRASVAAQVPAPRTHSLSVTASSRNWPRAALRRKCTATRSGAVRAAPSSRAATLSGIVDQPLHQAPAEPAAQPVRGEPTAFELIGHQGTVAVEHAQALEAVDRVPAHLARLQPQLAPDGLREQRGHAGAHALEHQVLHLRRDAAGEDARERFAQLLAVGEVPRLVLEIDAQDGGEQRLARLGEQRRHQRRRGPLEHDLADQQLHLRRGAVLDRIKRGPEPLARRVEDARLVGEVSLQREEVLRFLLHHQGEELAVRRPLARGQHQHLRDQVLAAALAGEQVREVEAGLAKDEGPPLLHAHRAERPEPLREVALVRQDVALGIDVEVPGQLLERPGVAERGIDQRCQAAHAVTACSETATVVPRPGSLSTRTVPCCAVTSSWTMERPSPVPDPGGLVLKNGSKMRARFSLGMPQPLSMIDSSTRSPAVAAAIRTSPRSGSTACTALWTMLRITWKRSCGLARTTS